MDNKESERKDEKKNDCNLSKQNNERKKSDNASDKTSNESKLPNEISNLTKPWISYAYAVCQGLQNQLNSAEETISSTESNENDQNNSIKQLRESEKKVMSKVLKELNSLTKKAMNIEQNCLKPNEIKESVIKSRSNDKKSDNQTVIDKIDKASINLNRSKIQSSNSQQTVQETNQSNQETSTVTIDQPTDTNNGQRINFNLDLLSNIIKNEFKCSICQELIVNATNLICSHVFCKTCIDGWLDLNNKKCPVCRTLITGNNRFRCLIIDNFLSLYFSNFTTEEQQADRTRLINEHRSREVIVINDDAALIQPRQQNWDDIFDSVEFIRIEEPRLRRRRRRRFGLENQLRTDALQTNHRTRRTNRQNSRRRNQFHSLTRQDTPMISHHIQSDSSSLEVLPPSQLRNNDEQMLSEQNFPVLAFEINMIDLDNNESNEPINSQTNSSRRELRNNLRNNLRNSSTNDLTILSPPLMRTNRTAPRRSSSQTNGRIRSRRRGSRSNFGAQSNSRSSNNDVIITPNRETMATNLNTDNLSSRRQRSEVDRARHGRSTANILDELESRRLRREERRRARRLGRLNISNYVLDRENN